MFVEEAQLATRLNHPNIVQVYDFQDYGDEGQLLSMEYVEGPDLAKAAASGEREEGADSALRVGVHRRRSREGPALRARAQGRRRQAARDRAPRRVAAEHPAQLRRRRENRRLRHREREPLPRRAGRAQGQDRVHVARASARREGRSAHRHLLARRRVPRAAHGPAAPRRRRGPDAARGRARRASSSRRARTRRTCRRSSKRS